YSSTFLGEEFFLADHRVRVNGSGLQKVLPGVAFLEMARAAIELASPTHLDSGTLELRDTVWLKPLVITELKQVSTTLFTDDNDEIGYEIYSIEDGQEIVHVQGQAIFGPQPALAALDVELLKRQMKSRLEAFQVYSLLAAMGLIYGSAHQGINALYLGKNQVLAELHAPAVIEASRSEYVLHPSVVDGALQASIGLINQADQAHGNPYVPFALESLRVLAPCTKEMFAWLRHSQHGKTEGPVAKLDIDICDHQGNICVQMRGFVSRMLEGGLKPTHEPHHGANGKPNGPSFDTAFYQKLITNVLNQEVSVDEAVELALGNTRNFN
ncbi:MAG: polyketide synthase dehydratase domain-containing protein, partial [Candidatus Angelobacter sp.]